MTYRLNLNDWQVWLTDAREHGLWDPHRQAPEGYTRRDPSDEESGEWGTVEFKRTYPTRVEEEAA